MTHRINPIGPHDRRITPVPRVERRERARDERDPEQEREEFEEQLERGLRQQKQHQPSAKVDLSTEVTGPVVPEPAPERRDPPDGHIDISV